MDRGGGDGECPIGESIPGVAQAVVPDARIRSDPTVKGDETLLVGTLTPASVCRMSPVHSVLGFLPRVPGALITPFPDEGSACLRK